MHNFPLTESSFLDAISWGVTWLAQTSRDCTLTRGAIVRSSESLFRQFHCYCRYYMVECSSICSPLGCIGLAANFTFNRPLCPLRPLEPGVDWKSLVQSPLGQYERFQNGDKSCRCALGLEFDERRHRQSCWWAHWSRKESLRPSGRPKTWRRNLRELPEGDIFCGIYFIN